MRKKLKAPPEFQQRYIVSPHDNVQNLFFNSFGMGRHAIDGKRPAVRPVFKDDDQRKNFHAFANHFLSQMGSGSLSDSDQLNKSTLQQLHDWSQSGSAMMDFKGLDKGQHPVVYTQGHGSAGDANIYSDTHQKVHAREVASMLNKMDLPESAQVRANSCFSGTAKDLTNEPRGTLDQHLKDHTLDMKMAGQWDDTFAGTLQSELHSDTNKRNKNGSMKQRHNQVIGYMGPTGQGAWDNVQSLEFGMIKDKKSRHMPTVIGDQKDPKSHFKRSDTKRSKTDFNDP